MKDFSFVIPCYNLAHYLPVAIESALGQTHGDNEVIVVDDGSRDETPEVAGRYGDRIRYIRKENAGLSAARNTGILHSEGRYVHFLDADDFVDPEFVREILEASSRHPEAGAFVTQYRIVDTEGKAVRDSLDRTVEADFFHQLLGGNIGAPVAFAIERSRLDGVGLFDVNLTSCEDWDLWLRLAASGCEFRMVEKRIANYREVPGSMSKNGERMWRMTNVTLEKAIRLARHGDCARCRNQARDARIRCAASFVVPSVWGSREGRRAGEWYRRPLRLFPLLARNPKLVVPYFRSRTQRVAHKLLRRASGD